MKSSVKDAQLNQMSNNDFSSHSSIIVMRTLKEMLLAKFGPDGTHLDVIYLPEYVIDKFLLRISIDISYIPSISSDLAEFNDMLNAFTLCIGKTLSSIKSVLSTLSIEELVECVAPRFELTDPF
jgi:hypothetical protein